VFERAAAKPVQIPSVTIDGWHVDYRIHSITKSGKEIRLEPKVMEVLSCLAERSGEVVTRQELEATVWAGRIVTEDALTSTVAKLRRVFGDDARKPRVIETIPKVGYRLSAAVTLSSPDSVSEQRRSPLNVLQQRYITQWVIVLAVVFVSAALLLWLLLTRDATRNPPDGAVSHPDENPAIVVLPFENLSADSEENYFAAGITADLITELSSFSGLFVIAPHTAFSYFENNKTERVIGSELGVRYVLIGTVRRSNDGLIITARLTDALNDRVLWAERYQRDLNDLFQIQSEVAGIILSALSVKLAPGEHNQLSKRYTTNSEAYDQLLRGRDYYARRSKWDNDTAKAHFEQAIRLDPGFARAFTSLALAHLRDSIDGWSDDPHYSLGRAEQLVEDALLLDESIPQVFFAQSQVALFRRNYEQAIDAAKKAIALEPNYADAYALLAWVLNYAGRVDQALEAMQTALRLNPQVPSVYLTVQGGIFYMLRRYDMAAQNFTQALELNPTTQRLRLWATAAYAKAGLIDEAEWEAEELYALNPELSLNDIIQSFPFRDPQHMDHLLVGLRRAGLYHNQGISD